MNSQHSGQAPHLSCGECQQRLQDYLDENLAKTASLAVFLHVRECGSCAEQLGQLQSLVTSLESMVAHSPPSDFDARVLASVPYEAYQSMADLRAPRVPVFLERESLPAWLRHPGVRMTGLVVTTLAVAGRMTGLVGDGILLAGAVSVLPQLVVWGQTLGRRVTVAVVQTREGA